MIKIQKCPVCGYEFVPRTTEKCCSMECRKKHRQNITSKKHICEVCGKEYIGGQTGKYCSIQCRRIGSYKAAQARKEKNGGL